MMAEGATAEGPPKLEGRCITTLPIYTDPERRFQPHRPADACQQPRAKTPFPVHAAINNKLHFWEGSLWQVTHCPLPSTVTPPVQVEADAIVNSVGENLKPHGPQSSQIFAHAGPELAQHCEKVEVVRTGEAKITPAGLLPATAVIHTVGPRFSVKYKTAAENTLHMAYWQCLETLVEQEHHTIAFDCLHSQEKGYPREAGVHIALRTVRRFLEKFGVDSISSVAFVVTSASDLDLYLSMAPLYFPRDELEEQWACASLPEDVGNDFGETVIPERAMSIANSVLSVPLWLKVDERQQSTVAEVIEHEMPQTECNADDFAAFSNMASNSSDVRARNRKIEQNCEQICEENTYMFQLNRAVNTDLSDIRALNLVYKSGVDLEGRTVMCIAMTFNKLRKYQVTVITPTVEIDYERFLLYLIFIMDPVTDRDYSLVLVCARGRFVRPGFGWMKSVYGTFSRKYKKNLKALHIVHPSFWIKTAILFVTPFVSKKFWKKVEYVKHVRDLYLHIDPNQVVLPPDTLAYDLTRR